MNAQFEQFAKDIPPPGFSEDDHPGGALHDYPGSHGAAGAAQAATAAGGSVAGAQAALAEPGALSTAAREQTSVTGALRDSLEGFSARFMAASRHSCYCYPESQLAVVSQQ